MIKNIFRIIFFVLYSIIISVGMFIIDESGVIPVPNEVWSLSLITSFMTLIYALVFFGLWGLMIYIAYKRIFKRR